MAVEFFQQFSKNSATVCFSDKISTVEVGECQRIFSCSDLLHLICVIFSLYRDRIFDRKAETDGCRILRECKRKYRTLINVCITVGDLGYLLLICS